MLQDLVSRCTEVKSHRCEANIVKFSPLSGEGLRERVNLEGRKIGWYEYRLFSVTHHILPFLGKDNRMGNNQYPPQPSLIKEGELPLFVIADSEAAPQSHNNCNMNEITTSNAPHSPRNDTKCTYRPNVLSSYRLKNKFSSRFTLHSSLNKRAAFTLAEVLITLGIIGVVAAMTIPTIVYKHQKMVSETAVKKFYTNINQAVLMAETQKGEERITWSVTGTALYDNYLKDYLKVLSADYNTGGSSPQVMLYFSDGTLASIRSRDITFCVNKKSYEKYKDLGYQTGNCMIFGFYPSGGFTDCLQENYYKKGVVPYLNASFNYCSDIENHDFEAMCQHRLYAKVLEQNGWRYPKECNVKF